MVTVRYLRGFYEVAINHLRRHLVYLSLESFHTVYVRGPHHNVWAALMQIVGQLTAGQVLRAGPELEGNVWRESRQSDMSGSLRARLLSAARFFGENHLYLQNVTVVRAGYAIKRLRSVQGYD